MKEYYSRLNALNENINNAIGEITGNYFPYTDRFTNKEYLLLKIAIQDIHNVLTLKLTLNFLDTIQDKFDIPFEIIDRFRGEIDLKKPNSTGFDIVLPSPINVIAEVKCIIPTKDKNRFNAAQKKNLFKDAYKLKTKPSKINKDDYYKFLVILDCGESTDESIEALLKYEAQKPNDERNNRMDVLNHLIFKNEPWNVKDLDKSNVYIVKQKL
jgi:hypothetical protein